MVMVKVPALVELVPVSMYTVRLKTLLMCSLPGDHNENLTVLSSERSTNIGGRACACWADSHCSVSTITNTYLKEV